MIIAITGFRRCGKDYLANALKKYFEQNYFSVQKLAFADQPKKIITDLANIDISELESLKENKSQKFKCITKEYNMREFLITFSNKLKEIDKDIWAKALINKIDPKAQIVIISDLRFKNEDKILRNYAHNTNQKYLVIKIESNLESCENNNIDETEINLIVHEFIFKNDKDNFNKEFERLIKYINSTIFNI